jgi:hypothetical protein
MGWAVAVAFMLERASDGGINVPERAARRCPGQV